MEDQTYIQCHACDSHNLSSASHCTECQSDLLPGKSLRRRLASGIIGIAGLSIVAFLLRYISEAPGLIVFLSTFPGLLALACFKLALGPTPLTDKYWHRAMRHMERCPDQAILDLTKALEASPNDIVRREMLERRGDAFVRLDRDADALADYRQCLEGLEPGSKEDVPRVREKMKKLCL